MRLCVRREEFFRDVFERKKLSIFDDLGWMFVVASRRFFDEIRVRIRRFLSFQKVR